MAVNDFPGARSTREAANPRSEKSAGCPDDLGFRELVELASELSGMRVTLKMLVSMGRGRPLVGREGGSEDLSSDQQKALQTLGKQLATLLKFRRAARELEERERQVADLNSDLEELVASRTTALHDSEERFRHLAENTPDVYWFVELNPERIRYVSPAVEAVWGLPPEHFYEHPRAWLEAVHPSDRRILAERLAGMPESSSNRFLAEYRILRPDGDVRWISYQGVPVRNEAGRILRVGGIASDVTQHKIAAENVRLSAERVALATKVGGVGIWEIDLIRGDIEWDGLMREIYGVPTDRIVESINDWALMLHPLDRAEALRIFENAVAGATLPFDNEFRIVRESDLAVRHVRIDAMVFRDEDGVAQRVVGTNLDVTESREREASLREALKRQQELTRSAFAGERAKSQFLAMMSHEMRTPLNGILGFAELLLDSNSLPTSARDDLETIQVSANALLHVLNDILDFSRIDSGQLEISNRSYSPALLLAELEELFEPELRARKLVMDLDVGESLPKQLSGDPGRVRQVLLNLVGNALKFTQVGMIRLSVRRVAAGDGIDLIEYLVEDSGPGIPPEKLSLIFESFTQADSSNARKYGGAGMGLAISRRLAELLGGSLSAANRPEGGAVFSLRLPLESLRDEPKIDAKSDLASAPSDRIGRILVVEDDRVNQRLIVSILRKLGHDAVVAKNGREAVELVERNPPSCVFMDLQMPEMDGFDATEEIRRLESRMGRTPAFISALTANVMPEDRDRCFAAGMDAFLSKPIRRQEIVSMLERLGMDCAAPDSAG